MHQSIVVQLITGGRVSGVRFEAVHPDTELDLTGVTGIRLVGVYCLPICTVWAIERLQHACIFHGDLEPVDRGHEGICKAELTSSDGTCDVLMTTGVTHSISGLETLGLISAKRLPTVDVDQPSSAAAETGRQQSTDAH